MRKVLICLLLVFLLILPVFAESVYVNDAEGLLSDREEQVLSQNLSALSHQYDINIVITTAADFGGQSIEDYAEKCWEKGNHGKDGILLLFSMTHRKYDIYYTGGCASVFDDEALDKLENAVVAKLKAGDSYGAATAFAMTTQKVLEDHAKEMASWAWKTPLICFAVGAVIALIVVLIMASRHKNVHRKGQAGDYVRPGSFHLTRCLDLYLYQTTTRRRRPQNSGSGGGSSRGGGGHRSGSF